MRQDAALSSFVCKSCLGQFYQCHGLLTTFLQRVNVSPAGPRQPRAQAGAQSLTGPEEESCLGDLVNPGTQGLYGLVGWVHGHAAGCGALPSLQHTLSSEYCGSLQTVWACAQGHRYTMDSDTSCGALLLDSSLAVKCAWDKELGAQASQHRGPNPTGAAPQTSPGRSALATGAETEMQPRMDTAQLPSDSSPMGPGPGPPLQPSLPSRGGQGQLGETQVPSSASDDRASRVRTRPTGGSHHPQTSPSSLTQIRGSLLRRAKAKIPRNLKNQESERNQAPSQAGRANCAVRGRSCPPSTSAHTRAARLCTAGLTA